MNSISIDRTSRIFTSVGFIGRFGYMRVVMNMTEWSESWWTTEEMPQSSPDLKGREATRSYQNP